MNLEWPETGSLARVAIAYAGRGWSVLPLWWPVRTGGCGCGRPDCEGAGKHPIWWLVPHGLHDATSRIDTIAAWWRSVPHANVGIRTGASSGLVVLDVDGQAGRLALRDLVPSHAPFDTLWARTGSGGWHAYFAHPGVAVPNSAGRLGVGLDVRGDGGYVVAPPSRHSSGRRYRWAGRDRGPAPMPAWMLDLAVEPGGGRSASRQVLVRASDVMAYASAAVDREVREVARALAGQRNHRLNHAAFSLGQLVGAGLLEEATVTAALVAAGLAAGPGERKIHATVRRGLHAGMRRPRSIVVT